MNLRSPLATGLVGLVTAALLAAGLAVLTTASASAASLWSITTHTLSSSLPRNNQPKSFEVACPSGRTPISGSYLGNGTDDIRRLEETVFFGSAAKYRVTLTDLTTSSTPGQLSIPVTISVRCVPTSYFSSSDLRFGSFTADASGFVHGTVSCAAGWYALSTRVVLSSASGGPIRTTTPTSEMTGWYAVATAPPGTAMWVWVNCVPASDIPGARMHWSSDTVGWNWGAGTTCAQGLVPIFGGTWQTSGSGAITTESRPTSNGWLSRILGGIGTMRTHLVCIPGNAPTVTVTGGPTPDPGSDSATWSFTVQDPAAAGGYSMATTCSFDGGAHQPCTSPYHRSSLADGTHHLSVFATTSDGRTAQGSRTVVIDTTPPEVAFDGPALASSSSPTVSAAVADRTFVTTLTCAVDGAEAADCGVAVKRCDPTADPFCLSPKPDHRGPQALALGPLQDGSHTLRVTATDERGNVTVADHAFTVDTTAPAVSQTTPTTRFTVGAAVTVRWSGHDTTSGVASYDVRWRRAAYNGDFGGWTTVRSPGTATARKFGSLVRGSTYCYSVRAVDHAGHTSAWTPARCTAIPLDDRDLARSSGWRALTPSGWFRQTALVTTTRGATLSVTGTTLKRVALVALRCPTCGTVGIYVRGTLVAKVNLAARTSSRQTLVLPAFSLRTGTVTVKVLSSGKKVQVDALGVTRR